MMNRICGVVKRSRTVRNGRRVGIDGLLEDDFLVVPWADAFGSGTILARRPLFTTLDPALSTG